MARPSLWRLLLAFLRIGSVSFGGGSSTLALLHEQMVVRTGWMDARQFAFTHGLSRIHPGIHLLAQSVLIGYLLRGWAGAAISLMGLLVPAALVTMLFTVSLVYVNEQPLGRAMIASLVPAAAGLALAVALQIGREQVRQTPSRQRWTGIAFMIGAFVAVFGAGLDTALAVLLSGLAGALALRPDKDSR